MSDAIKKPNLPLVMNEFEEDEWVKCAQDPLYFVENYVKVTHPTKGSVIMKLYPYQRECIESYYKNKNTILLAARQLGKCVQSSTIINVNGKQIEIGELLYDKLTDTSKFTYWKERIAQYFLSKVYK